MVMVLQEAVEHYLIGLLEDANLFAIHVKCITIMPYLWRAPPLLNLFQFLLVVGCVGVASIREGGVVALCNFEC